MKIDALATPALVIDAGRLGLPFRQALFVDATVISSRAQWSVADAGLKAFGTDHGNPEAEGAKVWFCSDEHVTFDPPRSVGDRLRLVPLTWIRRWPITTRFTLFPATMSRRGPSTHEVGSRDEEVGAAGVLCLRNAAKERSARPRCESSCFSVGLISANVRPPPPSGANTES